MTLVKTVVAVTVTVGMSRIQTGAPVLDAHAAIPIHVMMIAVVTIAAVAIAVVVIAVMVIVTGFYIVVVVVVIYVHRCYSDVLVHPSGCLCVSSMEGAYDTQWPTSFLSLSSDHIYDRCFL